MKNYLFILMLLTTTQVLAQEKIKDDNQNGLPDQHESAVLKAAERICNMPGIQEVLSKQIEDLKSEKAALQKQLADLTTQFKTSLANQNQEHQSQLKEKDVERDKVIADKDKLLLNLNDKNQELALCRAKIDEKTFDRLITAGIGIFGASSCYLLQNINP